MSKSIRYNTFTTSKMQVQNSSSTGQAVNDLILLEGINVLSTPNNIQGIRKLTALSLGVSVRNSYVEGSHFYDVIPCQNISAHICIVPEGDLYTLVNAGQYNSTFPIPQQTIAVCTLQSLLENGFTWTGSIDIPPQYYVVMLLWEYVPEGAVPKRPLDGQNYLMAAANMRLSF